jgi:CRISPR-associated endonuclease/helicase Cas3
MTFFAHSGVADDKSDWQPLQEHLFAVARLASANAEPFGMSKLGALLGLVHDLGKYDPRFPPRLEGANIRVDHSTAGAKIVIDLVRQAVREKRATLLDLMAAELAAYCVLGHHAGLPDRDTAEASSFQRRIENYVGRLDPIWTSEIPLDLSGLLGKEKMVALRAGGHTDFVLSVVVRFLFSALVDADYKDTEAHYERLKQRVPDRRWPALMELLPGFIARFDAYMAGKPKEGALNTLRNDILVHVRAKAELPPGLFTLTVPTGGGKTLASLSFALEHARRHGKRRIIYSIPFTSIIDQTAEIFRNVLGGEHILEHHSAIDVDEDARGGDPHAYATTRDRMRLAMEDWAAPVIVTTNIQLFESLFAARTSRARKLHNIANSVVILDEAQTIPRHLLLPCLRMIDALARHFGCTIILCTATQPALGKERQDGIAGFRDGLDLKGRELAPDPQGLFGALKRTHIDRTGAMDNAALVEAVRPHPQALVVVNSRRHALDLYRVAEAAGLEGLVHLTTRQCAVHRREILEDVRRRLKDGKPCHVIATSLIEAGVDVDFPRVWRSEAGLDSIIQAAGRCNREGKRPVDESIVTVFRTEGYEPPREIRNLVGDTVRALDRSPGDPQSLGAIEKFFEEVYWRSGAELDRNDVIGKLQLQPRDPAMPTNFAFRKVGAEFNMIESTMLPIIIPFDDDAKKAIAELDIEKIPPGAIARKLQTYIVQVPPRAREMLVNEKFVRFRAEKSRGDQFAVLELAAIGKGKDAIYNSERGLLWEKPDYIALENSII